MGNPFTTGGFDCCNRQDGTKYLSLCSCPTAVLITSSEKRNLSLCGFSEYGSTPSVPPKKYLVETLTYDSITERSISKRGCLTPVTIDPQCYEIRDGICYYYSEDGYDCNLTQSSFCAGDAQFETCITGPKRTQTLTAITLNDAYSTNNYVDVGTYDSSTCTYSSVRTGAGTVYYPADDRTTLCPSPNTNFALGEGVRTTTDITPAFTDTTTQKRQGVLTRASYGTPPQTTRTTVSQGVYSGTGCITKTTVSGAGNYSVDFGTTQLNVLSSEDTEANAISRSTPQIGTSDFTEIQVRGASYTSGSFSWSIQTAKYVVLFKGLTVGQSYVSGGLPIASGEIGESLEELTNIPISPFTATDTFEIINGTLNVTPEEFKEESFSLNASDYSSLSSGDLVITPDQSIPELAGYIHKVNANSFGSEPHLYIEQS